MSEEIEYTQGICEDGAAILADGQMLTIEQVLEGLRKGEEYKAALEQIVNCEEGARDMWETAKEALGATK